MHTPSVAIVILNWNGFADTVECLQSLRATTYDDFTVVLVDNGSEGGEGRRLQEAFPEVHLICNERNRGFSGGCNDGIAWAVGSGFDYVVTLNNDCLVEPDWLQRLIAGLVQAGADFGMCRMMYHPETELICSAGDIVLADGTGTVPHALEPYAGRGEVSPIVSACGGAAVYSRRSLEAVRIRGGQFFDELFFAYLEDIDLSLRLNALSFKGVCPEGAVVYHKESRSAGLRSYFQIYQSEKNRMLVELLNFPLWLVALGELYYAARTVLRNVRKLAPRRQRAARPLPAKTFSPWTVFMRSKRWVLQNRGLIWQDRRERKAKGMISAAVVRRLRWQWLDP